MSLAQHGGDPESIARQLGVEHCPEVALDFSVNLNPEGPPAALLRVLMQGVDVATSYPDEFAHSACVALAAAHGVDPEHVVVGNGSTEIFGWIVQALKPRCVGWFAPSYGGYREVCEASRVPMVKVATLTPEDDFELKAVPDLPEEVELLFIGSPNNPTGRQVSRELLLEMATRYPAVTLVVDASFSDFAEAPSSLFGPAEHWPENIVVVKSLTKFFSIAGLRLGMAWGGAALMAYVRRVRLPWSVNGLAQALAMDLYSDADYLERSRVRTRELRKHFAEQLALCPGFRVFPSDANFLLVGLPPAWPAPRLQRALLQRGILVRACGSFKGLGDGYMRLAVRSLPDQERFLRELRSIRAGEPASAVDEAPRCPALMVVGTTSNAGKSIVAAGFCRLLARRGVDVAPFKAQNMSLNSYVTQEGGEMGRAQVTQALAAGVEPHTDMNPVLLKPLGENGSQIIVDGQPIGNYKAREFYAMKPRVMGAAHAAYDRLAGRHDYIVLEGAGSPAEINLMAEDFVNMNMAAYAHARAILVADIDRGGVFASIVGTINLLSPAHRRLLVGVVINKFRGDVTLLDSGIRDVEAMTGVPVLGVLPYLQDLQIEDEDSLGLEEVSACDDAVLEVVVVRLPRISNFTDYLAMGCDQGIAVRYVDTPAGLAGADLVIIPGTKHTRADLEWMHANGLSDAVRAMREQGIPIVGICGGYQMLGEAVEDVSGVEGEAGVTPGLGLLPVTTQLTPGKELAQVSGVATEALPFAPVGTPFAGYEIHAGETAVSEGAPLEIVQRGGKAVEESSGSVTADGVVFGCYIHGLFDSPAVREGLWQWLCARKGVDPAGVAVVARNAQTEFDRVADSLEANLALEGFLTPAQELA